MPGLVPVTPKQFSEALHFSVSPRSSWHALRAKWTAKTLCWSSASMSSASSVYARATRRGSASVPNAMLALVRMTFTDSIYHEEQAGCAPTSYRNQWFLRRLYAAAYTTAGGCMQLPAPLLCQGSLWGFEDVTVFSSTFCERRGKKSRDGFVVQNCTTVQGSLWRVDLWRRGGRQWRANDCCCLHFSPKSQKVHPNSGEILCAQCFPATGNEGGGVGEKIQSLKEYMIACCLHFSIKS